MSTVGPLQGAKTPSGDSAAAQAENVGPLTP